MVGCSYIEGDAGFHRASIARAHVPVVGIPSAPAEMSDPIIQGALARAQRYRLLGFQNIAHIVLSYACFIRRFRPALVQTWMDYCNVLAGIAADMVGVPALVLSGRSAAPDNFSIFEPYMRPGYIELLRRQPELVFANNSNAGAADYGRWLGLPKEQFVVIHNGSDFPETLRKEEAAAHRRSLGIPERAPVVGSIIRFSEEKQPYLWVDTAMKVALKSPTPTSSRSARVRCSRR